MNKDILAKLPPVPEGAKFRVVGTDTFNHQPHPFCITPRHIAYAADHCGGMLTTDAIRNSHAPCGMGRRGSPILGEDPCNLSIDEHTHETAIVVVVPNDVKDLNAIEGLHAWLVAAKPVAEAEKIDGFMFPSEAQSEGRGL